MSPDLTLEEGSAAEKLQIALSRVYVAKEVKKLDAVNITDAEWLNEIKAQWNAHFEVECKKAYDERVPFIDKYGAVIMLVKTKHTKDKKLKVMGGGQHQGNYHAWFESILLSDKEIPRDMHITDNATKTFEKWYAPQGETKVAIGFVRGALITKYDDVKTENSFGEPDWVYCKAKGVEKITDLNKNTYQIIYSIKPIWQVLEGTITEA